MADKKISQLTSASTPLTGAEVLPIVQSGSTVKATIANVVGAGTSPGSFTNLTTSGANLLGGATNSGSGIKTQSPSYEVRNSGSDSFQQGVYFGGTTSAANLQAGATASTLDVWVYNGGWQKTCSFVAGNVSIPNGNFVPATAAKGVNFTANTPAAGMTSQLLNWYEEGTWTPADASGATLVFTNTTGYYTRVGRLVTVTFNLTYPTTANANAARIGGLPFTSANTSSGMSNGCFNINNSGQNVQPSIVLNATNFAAILVATGTSATNAQLTDATLRGGLTYLI